ncbi:tRNA (guanine(9)-N(1))-methyltransferase, partial [Modicella reniformis]
MNLNSFTIVPFIASANGNMSTSGSQKAQDVSAPNEDAGPSPVITPGTAGSSASTDTSKEASALQSAAAAAAGAEQNPNPQNNPFWKPRVPPMLGPDGKPLSRNATKKLLKQQAFLERKPLLKQQEKLKRKQKAKERYEAIEAGLIAPPPKRHKSDQIQTGITIGIDMSFDDLMLEKEVKSMVDQIKRCYSYNRTCEKIVHLSLTSFTGKSKEEFSKRANGFELWKNFTIHEKPLEDVWPSEEIPGKDHIEDLKRLQGIASAKSEAIKASALAAKATVATTADSQEKKETESTSTSTPSEVPSLTHSETAGHEQQQEQLGQEDTLLLLLNTHAPSSSLSSSSLPSENIFSAAAIKALEQERLLKEENLATIPAVKKVIYLSADSPNTITQLEVETCYVLGGIVDKNRYPNLCQGRAEKLCIETAQLPIGEYIQMSSRRVLTVNQVFEILLQFIECSDWKEAFLKVIPQRKLEEKQR